MSLPARGAWIEMIMVTHVSPLELRSLPARGAWIEMPPGTGFWVVLICRSPHGERGLKSVRQRCILRFSVSLPARGAWIEIQTLNSATK